MIARRLDWLFVNTVV